jgi:8-oxo-dGTP diphosphatase
MKLEFSAGGIVVKTENNQKLILVCQHSQHHGWVFPKGLIDDHPSTSSGQVAETKEEAALREVEEETGVKAKIIKPLTPVDYWYTFENEGIHKTVYYFLMDYIGGDITKHDMEMETVEWLPINEVEKRLTYESDKKVWEEAQKQLATSN